jgi:hypothetical protein
VFAVAHIEILILAQPQDARVAEEGVREII